MLSFAVSGATGFVGTALLRRLRAEQPEAKLVAIAKDAAAAASLSASGAGGIEARIEARVASLGDPNALAAAISGSEIVFHCAGESSHRVGRELLSWLHVAGSENLLNAARHAGVRRVVYVSCADATLIDGDRMSWREHQAMTQKPFDAWAETKLLGEELAVQQSDRTLEVVALRPGWVWGPGDRHTLPALCAEGLRGRVSLCGSGENLVPTVYIDNLIDALLAAATAPAAPGHSYHVLDGEVVNASEFIGQLCTSVGLPPPRRTVYALAYAHAALRERLGQDGLWRCDVIRRGRSALLDGTGAARELDYEPRVGIEAGMRALAAWVQQLGGAQRIAERARTPTSQAELASFTALANAEANRSKPSQNAS